MEEQQLPVITKIVLKLFNLDLQTFLQASTATIDETDAYHRTALYWASSRGDVDAVKVLLEYGADTSIRETTGMTPLHLADSPETVQLLLAHKAEISCRDTWDRTPLHWAVYQGKSPGVVAALMDGGADVNSVKWKTAGFKETALHIACDFGRNDLVKLLLTQGATVNLRPSSSSFTCLETAVMRNKADTVRLLIEHGAALDSIGGDGRAILHFVAEFGDLGVIESMLSGDLPYVCASSRDCDGRIPEDLFKARKDRTTKLDEAFEGLLKKVEAKNSLTFAANSALPSEKEMNRSGRPEMVSELPKTTLIPMQLSKHSAILENAVEGDFFLDSKPYATPYDEFFIRIREMPGSFED